LAKESDSPESVVTRGLFVKKEFPISEHNPSFESSKSYDLSSLIELSLGNNPYTQAAWFNALASAASVGEAKSPYYPKLGFTAKGGYDNGYNPIQTGPEAYSRVSINPGLELEYLLLDFGRRSSDVRRTVALLDAANLTFSRRVQTTVFAVQQAYFAHIAALSQQQAAKANLELSQTILAMVEAQVANGLGTKPELDAARKTLAQADFDTAAANRNAEVTLGNLRTAAGLQANAPLKVATPSGKSDLKGMAGSVDHLIDIAISKRPDLAAREAEIKASRAAVERAKADFLPKVSLVGGYSNESYGYSASLAGVNGTFNGNYNHVGGFAVMSWDLFDGFQRVESVKKRQAEESEARASAEATKLETSRDVWTAYNDSLRANKRVSFADSLVVSAEENFKSVESAFQNGLANITDLISNQSALAAARFEQAGAQADYLTSLASLSLAMGQFNPPAGTKVKPASL
jgi:outer membrane protein TolC